MYRKKSHIHFIGIGGIGMSGIAHILRYQGYVISGCDKDLDQQSIKDLQQIDCTVHEGNNTDACKDETIDILVYSSAIKCDNPEIITAQKRGIPTISRALMLAELMRTKYSVAIAGSHGKTTTTSLISHILLESKKDPTVVIGGRLKTISTNARFGEGDFLVAEADESDRSLLHLQATIAVLTNIDLEHLETYKDLDDIKATFKQFLNNIPFYGKAIVCVDDENVRSLLPMPHLKMIKYGIEHPDADIFAQNIHLMPESSTFNVLYKSKQQTKKETITLNMPGKHNITNALAAIAVARELDISLDNIQKALSSFKGIDRRFSYHGTWQGADIFDDYGHHPKELEHTLSVARNRTKKRLIVVFQPHRYSRTQKLWDDFMKAFENNAIDHLIITDIYSASETPIPLITSQRFVQALKARNPALMVSYAPYDPDFSTIKAQLSGLAQEGDLVLLQGAGKIYHLAKKLT